MFRALCAHHQEVNISLYSIWYHHTLEVAVRCTGRPPTECDDTRCCIMKFLPPDDKHIVLETCRGINKLIIKQEFVHYLLTPWCRVVLEKLTGLQLVKKFPAFHGTRRFITALTSVHHLFLSWASPIQSIYPHPTSWRSSLILSTHLRLGLPSGLLPSGFPSKTIYVIDISL